MKGSITFRKDRGYHQVNWYQDGIVYKITSYLDGQRLYDIKLAKKLLALMQADEERGVFRIEKYTRERYTDAVPYLREWLKAIEHTLKPSTIHDYRNSIEKHLIPFFQKNHIQLHEIQYDTLMGLLKSIKRNGTGKRGVMYVLHSCLDFAWRSRRIQAIPPFPKKRDYGILDRVPVVVSEADQIKVIEAMEDRHKPIFYWLKYHYRRLGEACALHRADFDGDRFTIRRTFSDEKLVDSTKTGKVHVIPMADDFRPHLQRALDTHKQLQEISPFLFVNPAGTTPGRHYSINTLQQICARACKRTGIEGITAYRLTKHSSCWSFLNEKGGTYSELQEITDHARMDSVKWYGRLELARRRELINRGKFGGRTEKVWEASST